MKLKMLYTSVFDPENTGEFDQLRVLQDGMGTLDKGGWFWVGSVHKKPYKAFEVIKHPDQRNSK